jgi:hypothetical protein
LDDLAVIAVNDRKLRHWHTAVAKIMMMILAESKKAFDTIPINVCACVFEAQHILSIITITSLNSEKFLNRENTPLVLQCSASSAFRYHSKQFSIVQPGERAHSSNTN